MAEFDIGLNGAQQQAAALVAAVHGLGKTLDATEFKSKKLTTEVARAMSAMDSVYDRLHRSMEKAGESSSEVNKALEHARVIAQNVFTSIAAANLKATVQAQAYNGSLTEMQRVLNDTASKNNYVKWQQKTAQLTNNLVGENAHLRASIAALTTEEGRQNAALKVQAAGIRSVITAEDRLVNTHNNLTQQSILLDTALGRETANLRVQTAAKEQLITLDTRIRANSELRQASIAALNTTEGRQNAILAVQEAHKRELVTADARLLASNSSLRAGLLALDTVLGVSNANLKAQAAAKEQMVTFDTRLNASTGALRQQLGSLGLEAGIVNANLRANIQTETAMVTANTRLENSTKLVRVQLEQLGTARGHENVMTKAAVAIRTAEITEDARLAAKLEALQRHYASLTGGIREQIAIAEQLIRTKTAEINETAREQAEIEKLKRQITSLNGGYQEEIVRLTAVRDARRKAIVETTKEKVVVDEQAAALAREKAQLEKLQQQMALSSSARGREITKIKVQILEQEKLNRILTMSTLELLGFTAASNRAASSNILGSQSAAMLRASLSGLQTNIGMYTSGTILAASATYALASALRSTVVLGAEFTASMAKADAIMSTGMASWMPTDMGPMEQQVRALGQSTMFTASEVALGLVELGQAGLSSADSIMALKPALDLAMIGGVTMAQSADMATNVMMTFGMEAKDLTGIVDMMATAASQSNTNVEQLANALTYAGPAAHTAGISMKDTTAAIEALSNTGIKASRAGTGLRKLFVSLLNPTKKGQAMLDQYGIAVTDMEGKTRGLVDILSQLNVALKDVGESERLGAIQNLVGLYATSPVAALVEQAGVGKDGDSSNLERLRRQLEDTGGAAEEMRKKMENSLKYDWKQVISAFEEAQLQLFKAHEYQLREATAKLSLYLIELTKPIHEIKDASGKVTQAYSELDMMLQNGKEYAEGLAYALAGVMAFKFAGNLSTGLSALAVDGKAGAVRLQELATRMQATSAGSFTLTGSLARMKEGMVGSAMAAAALKNQIGYLGAGAVITARALSGVAVAASALMRVLGWAGLVYMIGEAIYSAFGKDSQAEILAQQAGVNNLKSSYDSLKNSIDATAKARERAALINQQDSEMSNLGTINERRYVVEGAIDGYKANDLKVPTALEDELFEVDQAAKRAAKSIADAGAELDKLEDPGKRQRLADQAIERDLAFKKLQEDAAAAKKAYDDAEGQMRLKQKDAWDAAQAAVEAFKATLVEATEQSNTAAQQAGAAISLMSRLRDEQANALSAYSFEKNATSAQKLLDIKNQIADAEAKLKKAADQGSGNGVESQSKALLDLKKQEMDLQKEVNGTTRAYAAAQEALADLSRTDAERLARAKQDLATLEASKNTTTYGSDGLAAEAGLTQAEKELELRKQIKQIETSMAAQTKKDNKPAGKTDAVKELEAAQKAFDELQKKSDPLSASTANLTEKTKQLDLLLANNQITVEDRRKAMLELTEAHNKVALAEDKNYQSALKLKETYGESPFSASIVDLAEMGRLLEDGAVSMSRYSQMYDAFQAKQKERVLSGLPTGDSLSIKSGNSGFNPFGEFINTAQEVGTGDAAYATRKTDLSTGLGTALMNQDDLLKLQIDEENKLAEQRTALEHAAAMEKITKDDMNTRKSLQAQYTKDSKTLAVAQAEFAAQSGMMIAASMAGSLSDIFGQFAAVGDEATSAQKMAFVAQKALAIAQILLYTHVAAARAPAEAGPIFGMSLSSLILAQGYASAGLVGALAIGSLASGSSGGGGGGAQMYDTGGTIPYNRVGIVGEYGPELVQGPAHVTGRGASAAKLNGSGGGGGGGDITISPVIHVTMGEGSSGNDAENAKAMAGMVVKIVSSEVQKMIRPQGMLDQWKRNS